MADGPIYALALSEDNSTLYLGGDFTRILPRTGSGVPLDRVSAQPQEGFPQIEGVVRAVVADGSGGWFIGGEFTKVGGERRNHIAHILSDGTVDPTWNPGTLGGPSPFVCALALGGNTLYVGGGFRSVGGERRDYLAAVDALSGEVTAWNPGASAPVLALSYNGGTLYVGGEFTAMAGEIRHRAAAFDTATGALSPWNPDIRGHKVHALAVGESVVYVGGEFSSVGSAPRKHIAAVDRASGLATEWNPTLNDFVYALALSGNTVFAGGRKDQLKVMDATTGAIRPWKFWMFTIRSIAVIGDTLYAGGYSELSRKPELRAYNITTQEPTDWQPVILDGKNVYSIAATDAQVFIGGSFKAIGAGKVRNYLAAIDVATGRLKNWNPRILGRFVLSLEAVGNVLYVAGGFDHIQGQPRNGLAALDAKTGELSPWYPAPDGFRKWILAARGETVYVAGDFENIGGKELHHLAALDAQTGLARSWNPRVESSLYVGGLWVYSMALKENTAYLGGDFASLRNQERRSIAAVNARTGALKEWYPGGTYDVKALLVYGDTLYAGGRFLEMGGVGREYLAALDAQTGELKDWNPAADGLVKAFARSGRVLFVGGVFNRIGGQERKGLAAFDLAAGSLLDWNPTVSSGNFALTVGGDRLFSGGYADGYGSLAAWKLH